MDFNGDLLTRCGKTYLRAFLLWITGMALSFGDNTLDKGPIIVYNNKLPYLSPAQ